jgi:hypothetical protein
VRAADRLTETATRHKVRLRELARQAMVAAMGDPHRFPEATFPAPLRKPTRHPWIKSLATAFPALTHAS